MLTFRNKNSSMVKELIEDDIPRAVHRKIPDCTISFVLHFKAL